MQLTELRIGNWINRKEPNGTNWNPVKVTLYYLGLIEKWKEDFEGLPITEVLLHKFGFTYTDKGDRGEWHDFVGEWGVFCLDVDTDGYHIENDNHSIGRKLTYVHELQNVYYAITGKELAENFIEKAIRICNQRT